MKNGLFILLLTIIGFVLTAQPVNDNCSAAIDFGVTSGGFGYGSYVSPIIDISTASLQTGETFTPGFNNTDKSVWFKFSIATARKVTLRLSTVGASNSSFLVSMNTYNQGGCVPIPGNSTQNLILNLDQTGTKNYDCLLPGTYLIQVGANNIFSDSVQLTLTVDPPTLGGSYDFISTAYNFGSVSSAVQTVTYFTGCQTIDSVGERICPAITAAGQNLANYTQSTWHVFTTDAWVDYIAVMLDPAGTPAFANAVVGYWLYEGDVRITPGVLIDGCATLEYPNNNSREYFCELKANTSYSIKLLFNKSFNEQIKLTIRQLLTNWAP